MDNDLTDKCNHAPESICYECVDINNPPFVSENSPIACYKHALLRTLAKRFNLRAVVETGTCNGDTLEATKDCFDIIYSVELWPEFYKNCVAKFAGQEKIHLVFGDAAVVLGAVLDKIKQPCLIYEDAHKAGSDTADAGNPIPHELATIYEKDIDALVVIDDQHPPDFYQIDVAKGWTKSWRNGQTLVHKIGQYEIPERL